MLRALTSLTVGAPGAAAAAAQGVAEWLAQQTLEPLLALAGHSSWRVQVGEGGVGGGWLLWAVVEASAQDDTLLAGLQHASRTNVVRQIVLQHHAHHSV